MKSLQKHFQKSLLTALRVTENVTLSVTNHSAQKNDFHRVNCTLSTEEYSLLQKCAKSLGVRPTTLLKESALSHLQHKRIFSPDAEKTVRGLTLEIRKIGTNINQIAKHVNTVQKVGFPDLREVHKRISSLETLLNKAITYYRKV